MDCCRVSLADAELTTKRYGGYGTTKCEFPPEDQLRSPVHRRQNLLIGGAVPSFLGHIDSSAFTGNIS